MLIFAYLYTLSASFTNQFSKNHCLNRQETIKNAILQIKNELDENDFIRKTIYKLDEEIENLIEKRSSVLGNFIIHETSTSEEVDVNYFLDKTWELFYEAKFQFDYTLKQDIDQVFLKLNEEIETFCEEDNDKRLPYLNYNNQDMFKNENFTYSYNSGVDFVCEALQLCKLKNGHLEIDHIIKKDMFLFIKNKMDDIFDEYYECLVRCIEKDCSLYAKSYFENNTFNLKEQDRDRAEDIFYDMIENIKFDLNKTLQFTKREILSFLIK